MIYDYDAFESVADLLYDCCPHKTAESLCKSMEDAWQHGENIGAEVSVCAILAFCAFLMDLDEAGYAPEEVRNGEAGNGMQEALAILESGFPGKTARRYMETVKSMLHAISVPLPEDFNIYDNILSMVTLTVHSMNHVFQTEIYALANPYMPIKGELLFADSILHCATLAECLAEIAKQENIFRHCVIGKGADSWYGYFVNSNENIFSVNNRKSISHHQIKFSTYSIPFTEEPDKALDFVIAKLVIESICRRKGNPSGNMAYSSHLLPPCISKKHKSALEGYEVAHNHASLFSSMIASSGKDDIVHGTLLDDSEIGSDFEWLAITYGEAFSPDYEAAAKFNFQSNEYPELVLNANNMIRIMFTHLRLQLARHISRQIFDQFYALGGNSKLNAWYKDALKQRTHYLAGICAEALYYKKEEILLGNDAKCKIFHVEGRWQAVWDKMAETKADELESAPYCNEPGKRYQKWQFVMNESEDHKAIDLFDGAECFHWFRVVPYDWKAVQEMCRDIPKEFMQIMRGWKREGYDTTNAMHFVTFPFGVSNPYTDMENEPYSFSFCIGFSKENMQEMLDVLGMNEDYEFNKKHPELR